MNNTFDELVKGLAQSVTRRGALKKFGAGLGALGFTTLGLATAAEAKGGLGCDCSASPFWGCKSDKGGCFKRCVAVCSGG